MTTTPALTLTVAADGIATLVLDVPGESVNVLYSGLRPEFEAMTDRIAADAAIRAVVFTSGKKDNFLAGAKIDELSKVTSAAEAEALSRSSQQMLGRLEASKKPVVAAIHGACLGGGLETAMACHYRVATDDSKTVIGLPEVQLGLIPGAGGTQRLPRLVGLAAALDLILAGKQLKAQKARTLGIVDEVVPRGVLLEVAARRARELADGTLSIAKARAQTKPPVGDKLKELALEDNPVGRALLFREARAKLLAKTKGHYPATERALDAIRAGADKGFAAGLEAEARAFGELAVSDVSKRLVEIFFATQALKKDPGVDVEAKALPVSKVGVVGAGLMGAGVAYVSAAIPGWHVRLRDRDDASLGRGLSAIRKEFDERVKRKRMTRHDLARKMGLVSGGTGYAGFQRADLVVEAVFEDLALKHQVLRDVEAVLPAHAIFASNTSSLPITEIAKGSRRPERVIGMHYFSPVPKMPLLEIITHPGNTPEVVATAVAAGKAQGKTVVVVRDGVGFYTSRILAPYMNEAAYLLAEGARADDLDEALERFGYPVGPVTLLDEVGIDVAAKVGPIMERAFGERMKAPGSFGAFIDSGRHGRKAKKGFYLYDEKGRTKKDGGRKLVDPEAYDLLPTGRSRKPFPAEEMVERLALQMVNEAVLCLQEGILRSARDGDVGAIFGLGFPPFRGGPFRYVDACGAQDVVMRLEKLRAKFGMRFTPAPMLVEYAKAGKKFHA
jgi:3-hydroxyacyl-CoA dehydrogenase/enoyl-CoA hydratase/3-hydroxybutyryl-CoA epimerase